MSEIRKVFTSRFEEGLLVELDFSQLEIYALADLSGDKTLQADLLSGADLHAISAEMLFGKGFTPEQRKIAKQLSFQLQYGAGAKSMSERNKISLEMAKSFIQNYYDRYTGVKKYHDNLLSWVKKGRYPSVRRTATGNPAGKSKLLSPSKRIYVFVEEDTPWAKLPKIANGIHQEVTGFSPTKVKNYPVQGYATGDIVPMVLGKLYRELASKPESYRDTVLMVNTTHDSVLFDCCSVRVAATWAKRAREIMESAPLMLKDIFGIDFFTEKLPVGVTVGKDWYYMRDQEEDDLTD